MANAVSAYESRLVLATMLTYNRRDLDSEENLVRHQPGIIAMTEIHSPRLSRKLLGMALPGKRRVTSGVIMRLVVVWPTLRETLHGLRVVGLHGMNWFLQILMSK